jgi:hypothetical protein
LYLYVHRISHSLFLAGFEFSLDWDWIVVGIGEEAEEIAPAAPAYGSERLGGEEKESESFRWNILLAVGESEEAADGGKRWNI